MEMAFFCLPFDGDHLSYHQINWIFKNSFYMTSLFFLLNTSFYCLLFLIFGSATVHISVNDVNEYAPKFNQPSYVVDVDEGRPTDKILQVEANDADCSAKYGDICRYDILNKDQPFAIDNEGRYPLCFCFIIIPLFLLDCVGIEKSGSRLNVC